jgi:hypothetical protein
MAPICRTPDLMLSGKFQNVEIAKAASADEEPVGIGRRRPTSGRAFEPYEHLAIRSWAEKDGGSCVSVEIAVNMPHTPEMYGVVERGYVGPILFIWRVVDGIIIEDWKGTWFVYDDIDAALAALSRWVRSLVEKI